MINSPEESPDEDFHSEAGLAEDVLRIAAQTGLTACSGDGNWWLEAEVSEPLVAVPDANVKPVGRESRDTVRKAGEAAGERIVAAMQTKLPVEHIDAGVPSGAHEVAQQSWSEAVEAIEATRRLLNGWLILVLGQFRPSGVDVSFGVYRQTAEDCFYAIVTGRRETSDDELGADQAIDALLDLSQPPLLSLSVGQRARVLAERIKIQYDIAVYSEAVAQIEAQHFARPRALPHIVDVEPAEVTADPVEAAEPVLRALLADSETYNRTKVSGISHRATFEGLSKDEAISISRALRNKESLLRVADWIRSNLNVETETGSQVAPPWDHVSLMLAELGEFFDIDPCLSGGTLAKEYGLRNRGKALR